MNVNAQDGPKGEQVEGMIRWPSASAPAHLSPAGKWKSLSYESFYSLDADKPEMGK